MRFGGGDSQEVRRRQAKFTVCASSSSPWARMPQPPMRRIPAEAACEIPLKGGPNAVLAGRETTRRSSQRPTTTRMCRNTLAIRLVKSPQAIRRRGTSRLGSRPDALPRPHPPRRRIVANRSENGVLAGNKRRRHPWLCAHGCKPLGNGGPVRPTAGRLRRASLCALVRHRSAPASHCRFVRAPTAFSGQPPGSTRKGDADGVKPHKA